MSRPPCIVIDATPIGTRRTGAGRALRNLVRALPLVDPASRYITLATAVGAAALAAPGIELVTVSMGGGLQWELVRAGKAAQAAGADLLFTVRELTPLSGPRTVVHIYEPPAYRLRSRELHSKAAVKRLAKDALLHLALGRSLRRAAAVTAGSATTAAWLRERLDIDARVVYPGIDPAFFSAPGDSAQLGESPYFLHPSTGDDRENTDLVLAAFARARFDGVRLVLVGASASLRSRLTARVRELRLAHSVELLGWVTDEQLVQLYRGAIALLHPTRYESFAGFAALEAMTLGTPVLALEAPGSTEALSGAALLLQREDPELLSVELRRLVDDETLRARLAARGRELARPLTWESSASALAGVFHEVLDRSPHH